MTLQEQLELSYYKHVADIHPAHGVSLVQHTVTGAFRVRKDMKVYSRSVLEYVKENPIPHVPKIHFLAEEEDLLISIEDYIPGTLMSDLCKEAGKLTEKQIIGYGIQLCDIVGALHAASPAILHRDIKPSNLIIAPDDQLWLLDLNAAKWVNTEQERDTVLLGTHGYAAPEQYGFGASSIQTDIYGIGACLRELCGVLPQCDPELDRILTRCTRLEASYRYHNTEELRDVLENLLAEQTVEHTALFSDAKKESVSWVPPGFRSGKLRNMILAVLGYVCILWSGLTLSVDNMHSVFELWMNRIFFMACCLVPVILHSNYRDVQRFLPFHSCSNVWLRRILLIVADVTMIFAIIIVLVLYENICYPID